MFCNKGALKSINETELPPHRSLAIREKALGPEHPDSTSSRPQHGRPEAKASPAPDVGEEESPRSEATGAFHKERQLQKH